MNAQRILARVIVDQTHPSLLNDLLQYRGRQRSRRISHLAAIGQLVECGAFRIDSGSMTTGQASTRLSNDELTGKHAGELRPLVVEPGDLDFIGKLGGSLT